MQVLVDPGSPYADEADALDAALARDAEAGRPLGLVALTHHHGDHVGGAARVAARWNVPIAAHAETARRLAGRVAIAREVADGETIDAGGVAMTCLHTPGHAPGHLCFETAHAIVAGDMVAGIGWILVDPSEGDMTTYLASLDALLARPAVPLLPAHGPTIVDGRAKLREYIAHRLAREAKVVAALARRDGDATIAELVPEVYADTPRPLWPIASRVLRAHLDKLARDDKARETATGRWAVVR
jgi:glyoxylase-like metal-dependent hydrolase (beta-lactamase superfamily II)